MNGRIFLDTSVLVYAYDRSEPGKQRQAIRVLDALATSGRGVISTQVLAEFFVTVTRKIVAPLTVEEGYERVQNHLRFWMVLSLTGPVVLEAIRGVRDHQFHFWDAMVWATARLNQVWVVFTEDFPGREFVEGVHFVNPFSGDFRLEDWA